MPGSGGLVPWVELDFKAGPPLYLQLYEQLRGAVLRGRLGPGTRLPSSRALAEDLRLSRSTVVQAYQRLWSEGYLESRMGSGTRITSGLPEERLSSAPAPRRQQKLGAAPVRLSRRAQALATSYAGAGQLDTPQPFLPGYPAIDRFPLTVWRRLLVRRLRSRSPAALLRPPEPAGDLSLRTAIADHLRIMRGVRCTAEQVVITTGTQQALARLTALLLDPGDAAWLEDPGYLGARRALLGAGARIVPVPVDTNGIDVEAGMARAPRARLAYVSPSHQFPLGVTMSLERRLRLLHWASDQDAWILEDDYDGEFRYEERPLQALQGLDDAGRVIYLGTFGKILFPALRLGYAVLPPSLVQPFVAARGADDGSPPLLEQLVLADFMREEHLARHLRRMRLVYRERRDALLEALARHCGDRLVPGASSGGIHLTARLEPGVNDGAVSARARKAGVTAFAVSEFALEPVAPGLVLGFAGWSPGRIRSGVEVLSQVLG